MSNNIYISTATFKTKALDQILTSCLENQITNLELGSNIEYSEDIVPLIRKYNRHPMNFLIHNYFPPHKDEFILNLASDDNETITRCLEHCYCAIDLSAELGIKYFSVHAGYAFKVKSELFGKPITNPSIIHYHKAYEIFLRNIKIINDYAQIKGIKLLIENHEISHYNLVNGKNSLFLLPTSEELLKFFKDVNSDNLGFLIDLGHLNVTAHSLKFEPEQFIIDLAPYITIFHLSGNDGSYDRHWKFDQDVWFKNIIPAFNDRIFVIESWKLEIEEIKECHACILDMLNKMRKE
ncbi:MAG: sugar phosphate isomerase/epimerase family protein [bacterium]